MANPFELGEDNFTLKQSGKKQEFDSGAQRDTQEGKGRYDLIPAEPLRRLAVVYEKGAKYYGDRNWEKGMPLSRYASSALRHLVQAINGKVDEDHLAQAAWNIFSIIHHQKAIADGTLSPELDDLPTDVNSQPEKVSKFES